MSRNPLFVALAVVFGGTVLAAAAALIVQGGVLQAGGENDLVCDEDGVTVAFKSDDETGLVKAAKISDIDEDCYGASLKFDTVSETEGGPFFVGSIGAPSYTFMFSSHQEPSEVEEFSVAIFGSDSEEPNQGD
jgi:hypothetical protein